MQRVLSSKPTIWLRACKLPWVSLAPSAAWIPTAPHNNVVHLAADDNRPIDEPDENVEQNAYRGVSFDDWAKLTVRVSHSVSHG